jgi:hypothetical protein
MVRSLRCTQRRPATTLMEGKAPSLRAGMAVTRCPVREIAGAGLWLENIDGYPSTRSHERKGRWKYAFPNIASLDPGAAVLVIS